MARHLKESKAPDPIIEIHGVPVEIVTPNYAEGEFGDLARGLADELQMACDFFYKSPSFMYCNLLSWSNERRASASLRLNVGLVSMGLLSISSRVV